MLLNFGKKLYAHMEQNRQKRFVVIITVKIPYNWKLCKNAIGVNNNDK